MSRHQRTPGRRSDVVTVDPEFTVGTVVVPRGPEIDGADPFTKLVVIAVTPRGILTLAPLGGSTDGHFWRGIPSRIVRRVQP